MGVDGLFVLFEILTVIIPIIIAALWIFIFKGEKYLKICYILIGVVAFSLAKKFETFILEIAEYCLYLKRNVLYIILEATPGIFEEVARFISFYFVVNVIKNRDKNNSISYGIGHGGALSIIAFGYFYFLIIGGAELETDVFFLLLFWLCQNIVFQIAISIIMLRGILKKNYLLIGSCVILDEIFRLFFLLMEIGQIRIKDYFNFLICFGIDAVIASIAFYLYRKMAKDDSTILVENTGDEE